MQLIKKNNPIARSPTLDTVLMVEKTIDVEVGVNLEVEVDLDIEIGIEIELDNLIKINPHQLMQHAGDIKNGKFF